MNKPTSETSVLTADNANSKNSVFDNILLYTKNTYIALIYFVVFLSCIKYLTVNSQYQVNPFSFGVSILVNIFLFVASMVLFHFLLQKGIERYKQERAKKNSTIKTPEPPKAPTKK